VISIHKLSTGDYFKSDMKKTMMVNCSNEKLPSSSSVREKFLS